jgi:hypothetical protein
MEQNCIGSTKLSDLICSRNPDAQSPHDDSFRSLNDAPTAAVVSNDLESDSSAAAAAHERESPEFTARLLEAKRRIRDKQLPRN